MSRKHILAPYIMEKNIKDLRVADIQRMTHLNIAFGHVKDSVVTVDHLEHLDKIAIYKKINPELKVILSVGGWGADGFNQAAQTQEGRELFAKTTMGILEKWDFDGTDIDWEYPSSDQSGIAYGVEDKVNFTLLLQALRAGVDGLAKKNNKPYILTAAVGGDQYFIDGTEMDKVAKILDFVNLMTYDLRGGFTDIAGHHASLGAQTGDENGPCSMRTVRLFHEAGVPYDKMVLGAAFYGRMWSGVSSNANNGLGQKAETKGVGHADFDLQDEKAIKLNGYTRYFDEQAKAPYLFNGENFISYEDSVSIKAKCDYVKEKGLAGMMYWAYGEPTLFEVMAENLD